MYLPLAIVLVFGISFLIYNSLIGKKNEVENALGGLDVHLKQRFDLVPNLVSSVKTFMKHESDLLQKITELRTGAAGKKIDSKESQDINKQLSNNLSALFVQVEQYPELKSNSNFINLQESLFKIEENITASRRFYNAAVTDLNNAIEMFPSNVFARLMGLQKRLVFNIPEVERQNVSVKNLFEDKAS